MCDSAEGQGGSDIPGRSSTADGLEMAFQYNFPMASTSNPEPQHAAMASNIPDMSPWMQVPPSVMPWTMENRPRLVRFGEPGGESDSWGIPRPKFKYHKRKSDLDFNPKPAKMHISEDKVAAQLKNMHISSIYADQGFGEALEKSDCMLPMLTLSKEVQSLPSFQDALLPQSILSKIEKPTRALVLWKPPAGSLSSQMIANLAADSDEETDNVNNNTATPNLNTPAVPSASPTEFTSSSTEMEM